MTQHNSTEAVDPVADALKALKCLRLEVPASIVDDVEYRVKRAFAALHPHPEGEGEPVAWVEAEDLNHLAGLCLTTTLYPSPVGDANTPLYAHPDPQVAALTAELERVKRAGIGVTASLLAAISLLEGGGKKAAASDKMFEQMLRDYSNAVEDFRDALTRQEG